MLDLQEPLEAAHVLVLELFQAEDLLLLVVNSLDKLIDVCLLFVKVHLVVILVLLHIALFHTFVFGKQFLMEFCEKLVVSLFEQLDVAVVLGELDFLADHGEIRAGGNHIAILPFEFLAITRNITDLLFVALN